MQNPPHPVVEPLQTLRNPIYPPVISQNKEVYGFFAQDGSLAWIWSAKEIHCYNLNDYMRNYVFTLGSKERDQVVCKKLSGQYQKVLLMLRFDS
jgi:hypothetical protein